MFLAESVIPPAPIGRTMCFNDFSEVHYNKMNDDQRLQFFNHVTKCEGFSLEKEDCEHFYARFDPKNQYKVYSKYRSKEYIHNCYFYRDSYRVNRNSSIIDFYITKIIRIHDSNQIL